MNSALFGQKPLKFWPISGSCFGAIAQMLPGAQLRIVSVYMMQAGSSQHATIRSCAYKIKFWFVLAFFWRRFGLITLKLQRAKLQLVCFQMVQVSIKYRKLYSASIFWYSSVFTCYRRNEKQMINLKGLTECRQAAADTLYCIELCQSLQFSRS